MKEADSWEQASFIRRGGRWAAGIFAVATFVSCKQPAQWESPSSLQRDGSLDTSGRGGVSGSGTSVSTGGSGPPALPTDAVDIAGDGQEASDASVEGRSDAVMVGRGRGLTCVTANDCESGACSDGVCCDRTCDQVCETCARRDAPGTCSPVIDEPDQDTCSGDQQVCIGHGQCGVFDQRQPLAETTLVQNRTIFHLMDGTHYMLAQSLRVGKTGRLAALRLQTLCLAEAEYTLELRTAVRAPWGGVQPSDVILTSTQVHSGLISQTKFSSLIVFSQPITVERDTDIALVLRGSPKSGYTRTCRVYLVPGNPYREGEALFYHHPESPAWNRLMMDPGGGPYDLSFETIVLP